MFSTAEKALPLIILTTKAFSQALREEASFSNIRIETWKDALLSSAPWVLLKKLAQENTRFLLMMPEGKNMVFASFVMEN
ncbi:hypothetical protein A8A01_06765 [Ewingella americana]|nr:hypothetical protein A8A01_06765 [Ewingella americana]